MLFLLKELFKKDNLSNILVEFLSDKLKEIELKDIPESYQEVVQKNIITTEELKLIWDQGSTINNWNQVRSSFPDKEMSLYGPGTDSGTFDYFTDVINGEEGKTRADYTPSEDDNVLVMGVSGDKGSIGYFGYAYYIENESQLKLLSVDGGTGCVAPSEQTINDSSYAPLARPMYIYVNNAELSKPEVYEFVKFYLENGKMLSEEGGYVGLPIDNYNESLSLIAEYK